MKRYLCLDCDHHVQEVCSAIDLTYSLLFALSAVGRRFDGGSDITGFNQAKSSVVRGIRY